MNYNFSVLLQRRLKRWSCEPTSNKEINEDSLIFKVVMKGGNSWSKVLVKPRGVGLIDK